MKTLSLYIDRWYIAAAICYDNIPRRIDLPNAYSGGYPFSISGDIRSVPS